jgi:hypothetical protein
MTAPPPDAAPANTATPATSAPRADALTALPLPHDLKSETVYNRVNLPWFNFGVDFGTTVLGKLGIRDNPNAMPMLDELHGLGVEDVVTWTIPDGRNVLFDDSGTPTGLAPGFQEDLTAWLDGLAARGMSAELVLIDGNTWFKPDLEWNGLHFQGHGDVVGDLTGERQRAFDHNVLAPILQTLQQWRDAHPGQPFPISGINLGNELLYGVNQDLHHPWKNVFSIEQMQSFVRGRAAFVHWHLPGVPVTLGAASPQDLLDHWTDASLGGRNDEHLDYYTFHHYGTQSMGQIAASYPWASLGKRVHLGEYPGTPRPNGPAGPAAYLAGVRGVRGDQRRPDAPDRFVQSATMWASQDTDPAAPADPPAAMRAIEEWFVADFVPKKDS